ncbi:MAG: hypothetical protein KIS76_06010 [Pyrinomonadaceae bacterium]|nr:hypothetical protein [Pyrinomonadaceae bacterium]
MIKNLRIIHPIFIVVLLFAAGSPAQSPSKILKNATKAYGGEKALKSVTSWRKSGLITRLKDNSEGEFHAQAVAPNLYNSLYDLNGFEIEVGSNGKSGWIRDSREGLRTLVGDASRDFQAEVEFRNLRWIDYKKQKIKISSGGQGTVNGNPANIVIFTDPRAVSLRLFFDTAASLLVREEIPANGSFKVFEYSDFRPVNGVKEPFRIDAEIDGEKYVIELDQIIHNFKPDENDFDFPRISGEPLPDIPKLLAELQTNENRVEEILEDYSYKQTTVRRELGKDGDLRVTDTETYLLTFYKGNRIRRLIEKNGKPLSASDQEKEDREVQNRVKEIEKQIAKEQEKSADKTSSGAPDENSRRISIAEVLRASNLINPRRERLKNRDVIVFDFEPNPDFDFSNAQSLLKFFGKTGGVMWIDEEDKQVARIEAELFDSYKVGGGLLAKLRKGASFILEQERVNDEIWLPATADINLSVRVLLFGGVKINQVIRSYDYEKFQTSVEGSKIGDIQKP